MKKIEIMQMELMIQKLKSTFGICAKKGCKFYDNGCAKGRVVRECAKKGLKNRD